MAWGSLTVGRIALSETDTLSHQVNASSGEQSVAITGLQSMPPLTQAQARARAEDLMATLDTALPLIFTNKDNHTGFYSVKDVGTKFTDWAEAEFFKWTLSLTRIGTDNSVDMESRLASVVRLNDFALTGERWHAPSPGAYGYFTGTTQPSGQVVRPLANSEGSITVYRGIPANVHPRWGISAPNYLKGRARLLVSSQERSGIGFRIADATNWELNNGLVRVKPRAANGLLDIGIWDTAAWSDKAYDITAGGAITAPFDAITVLRNDFEAVVIRLVKTKAPGRILVDLTLRRGARFVEGYIQTDASATLGIGIGGVPLNQNPYFETNVLNWFPKGGAGVTIARSTLQFHEGVASMLLTPNGTAVTAEYECDSIAAIPGQALMASAWVRCSVARNYTLNMNYFSGAPGTGAGYLGSTAGTPVALVANTWTLVTTSGSAPASTNSASLGAYIDGTPANTVQLWTDEATLTNTLPTTNNAATGYIVATANDADGNRAVMGSPRTFTGSTTGGITKAASTAFAFWVGVVLDGAAPLAGDAATDLRNQYIGALAEQTLAVKR